MHQRRQYEFNIIRFLSCISIIKILSSYSAGHMKDHLCMCSANERQCYIITSSFIGCHIHIRGINCPFCYATAWTYTWNKQPTVCQNSSLSNSDKMCSSPEVHYLFPSAQCWSAQEKVSNKSIYVVPGLKVWSLLHKFLREVRIEIENTPLLSCMK